MPDEQATEQDQHVGRERGNEVFQHGSEGHEVKEKMRGDCEQAREPCLHDKACVASAAAARRSASEAVAGSVASAVSAGRRVFLDEGYGEGC